MVVAYILKYPITIEIPGAGSIISPANVVYFPQDKIALVPGDNAPLDGKIKLSGPKVLSGDDAEAFISWLKSNAGEIIEADIDPVILAWAKLYPNKVPSIPFQRRVAELIYPGQVPNYSEAELLKYQKDGIEQAVSGVYIQEAQAFLEFEVSSHMPRSIRVTARYGFDATLYYSQLIGLYDVEVTDVRLSLSTLESIIDTAKLEEPERQERLLSLTPSISKELEQNMHKDGS